MKNTLTLVLISSLIAGCQTSFIEPQSPIKPAPTPTAQVESERTPAKGFSQDSLYQLLVAELAGQRNRFDIALSNYNTQAQLTQDPAVAERAYRIADYLGAQEPALDNALIWAKAQPDSLEAQRASAIQLARAGRFDESLERMEQVLLRNGDTHFDFLALSAAETDPQTRTALLQSFERLLQKNPGNAQLIFAKALLLQQEQRTQEALDLLAQLPEDDSNVAPLMLRVRLLQQDNRSSEALALLDAALKKQPDDRRLLLTRARLLVSLDRLEEASSAFAALLQRYPNDEDLRLSLALLYLEQGAWREAEHYLLELLSRQQYLDAAHYNLGRAYEELDEPEKAITHFRQVSSDGEYLSAQLRLSELLFSTQRAAEARRELSQARTQEPEFQTELYLIEIQGLANHGDEESAWQLINTALEEHPNDPSLLYNRAMLAENRDDLALLERDLRSILEQQPDNSTALNALGYTLADRTTRYEEALALIEQAHTLNPEDPATLDSLGWVHYRLGNLEQAKTYLQQAYQQLPDHEVAAHLGEVLWQLKQREQARAIWKQSLQEFPDSPILRSTILRLTGSETP